MGSRSTNRPYRHIKQACQNCRAARAKCDGRRPCNRCSEKRQECAYAASGDGRSSRLDFRYKVAELQHENWVLRHFVTHLQQSTEQDHHEVLGRLQNLSPNFLRSNVDVLYNLTRQVSSLPDQPYLASPGESSVGQGQDSCPTFDPGPQQAGGWAEGLESTQDASGRQRREPERVAPTDTALVLRILRLLREIPAADRNLVLETLPYILSPQACEEKIRLHILNRNSAQDVGLLGLSNEQSRLLGSPGTRNLPESSAILTSGYPPGVQARQLLNFKLPDFAILPLVVPVPGSKSLLGTFLVSFLDAVSSALAQGTPVDEIIGPPFVDVEYLLRDREPHENALTIAVWAGNVLRSVLTTDLVPPLAGIICITRLLRWMISPTLQHYAEIPEMARPLPIQRFVPHHAELDLCPHPAVRTAIVYKYRNWFALPADEVRIQWSGSPSEMIETDPVTGHRRPTELFESHATSLENWSFNRQVLDEYPEIAQYGAKIQMH